MVVLIESARRVLQSGDSSDSIFNDHLGIKQSTWVESAYQGSCWSSEGKMKVRTFYVLVAFVCKKQCRQLLYSESFDVVSSVLNFVFCQCQAERTR